MNLKQVSEQAETLIKKVGSFIRFEASAFDESRIELKGLNDLVSYVDKSAEEQLVAGLKSILPEAGFIAEEGTASHDTEELVWIVDPLDGTTNFTHGLPVYSISVALMQQGNLKIGLVYEINKDEMFRGIQGLGASLNDLPIQVSERKRLSESLIATGFPYNNFDRTDDYLEILQAFMKQTHGVRRLGSAAVDLAYVACGRFEGFYEYNLNPWDVAAGILIVKEAGGIVSDFSGEDNALFGREIIAAGKVHSDMQKLIGDIWFA